METEKTELKNFTLTQMRELVKVQGWPAFRAQQIFAWLYRPLISEFSQMTDISKEVRAKLADIATISRLTPAMEERSQDGSVKYGFRLADGAIIESVLIPEDERLTLCVSSQVGCAMGCNFCLTGTMGFVRNLSAAEIVGQVQAVTEIVQAQGKNRINNLVFMGMGEPLANFDNLIDALNILMEQTGLDFSSRRITVSTCGIVPGIKALKALKAGINLSVSLHAADNRLRNTLMPINKIYPLEEVMMACRSFAETKKGDITFEYVLIKGKNDSLDDAGRLAALAKKVNAKINLLSYSPIPQSKLRPSGEKTIKAFASSLEKKKTKVTLRRSKGADIAAACGQLAVRITSKQK